ncbi:MAG: right-handed parallel beta-helix repeat-containing protein [Planctomycetota bacterium]
MSPYRVAARQIGSLALLLGLASCAGGSGGGGGGDGGIDPPADLGVPPFLPGLVSAVGAPGAVRLDWFLPDATLEVALFQGATAGEVYDNPPVAEDLAGTSTTLAGLTDGVELHFGLGVRSSGARAGEYTPAGLVLAARPGDPIYVDAAAPPGGDGTTPATAYDNLRSALLVAILQGGANLWVREGEYAEGFLPLFAGTHVYGGFEASFDLAARDAAAHPTVVLPAAGQRVFDVQGETPAAVIDGLLLDGGGAADVGVDVLASELQIRGVEIRDFADRGIRMRNTSSSNTLDVRICSSNVHGCGADGLSLDGAFDLRVDGSSFDANVQEGMDLDTLLALDGAVAQLHVTGSRFAGNGTEGLDADLAAPLFPQIAGGLFVVEVRGCLFALNGAAGVLIDEEYELAPLWTSRIEVRECLTRANAGEGAHVDADGAGTVLLHRLMAAGNGSDGIWVSSETHAGMAVVSACVCAGNLGAGLRASLGNTPVVAMHDVFTGNQLGGFRSEMVESSAASCVAYLQGTPWLSVRRRGCMEMDDPFAGTFENAAEAFAVALARSGTVVTLDDASSASAGFVAELADDGSARTILSVDASSVTLDTEPAVLLLPARFALFAPGSEVLENYMLPPGSPAAGAGMTPPGGPIVDAGVWGSPAAGWPGVPDPVPALLFPLVGTEPALAAGMGTSESIAVLFAEDLDPASLAAGEVRALDAMGGELAIDYHAEGSRLVVDPPAGGWGLGPVTLELHRGLASLSGRPLATPAALPLVPH